MFTGIVQQVIKIESITPLEKGQRISFSLGELSVIEGDSIAVNGCCLTALKSGALFIAELSLETLDKTNLGQLSVGSLVNVEPALKLGDAINGHLVLGHVDKTVMIQDLTKEGAFHQLTLGPFDKTDLSYLIHKGSITVDGISLTLNQVTDSSCQITIIPHTFSQTNLQSKKVGDAVNIEFDYYARVIHHQLKQKSFNQSTMEIEDVSQ